MTAIIITCIVVAVVIVMLILIMKDNEKEKETAEGIKENTSKLENFEATKTIGDDLDIYRVMIDEKREKVAYVSKNGLRVFSFDDIISVELIESGKTVYQKSTTRTIGGAILGGIIAGGAGSIIGGLSGSGTERRKITSIVVKVTLRDVSDPTVNIVIFENFQLPPYSDDDGMVLFYAPAIEIVDTFNVIIDLVDKRSNPQPKSAKKPETNLSDEILKLHQMLKDGIITEEEFSKMKEKLINS